MSQPPSQPPRPSGPTPPSSPSGPGRCIEELYTVPELAKAWRCSTDHIYDLIAHRELRTVPIGVGRAKTRIPASAVAEFMARRTVKAKRRTNPNIPPGLPHPDSPPPGPRPGGIHPALAPA